MNCAPIDFCRPPSCAAWKAGEARRLHTRTPFAVSLAAWVAVLLVGGAPAGAREVADAEIQNRRCLNCHGQSHIATLAPSVRASMVAPAAQPDPSPPATRPELYIPGSHLTRSVHAALACTDCHSGMQALPHAAKHEPVNCATGSCHSSNATDYLAGSHAAAAQRGDPAAPTCVTCHGGHEVQPKTSRASKTHPLNIVKVCGDCHSTHATADGESGEENVRHYLDSVHGRAVAQAGLIVAATCADCHGEHKVLPSANRESPVHRENVADTCGNCHVGVSETFTKSIHGQKLLAGDPKAPVCSDCHTAHAITRTDTPSFMLDLVTECGDCHDRPADGSRRSFYETYRASYHGQVNALGYARSARCSDCHGAHDVQRINDPASRLNPDNIVATCRTCHPRANASFAEFQPHADHRDRERYPLLHGVWLYFVVMMSFAFGFFGLHSAFWFVRSIIERIRHGAPHHHAPAKHAIKRFNRVDRVNHAFVIISFFGLTITGLPLLYADKGWARAIMAALGGVQSAGWWHRVFAIMLLLNFAVHFVGVYRRFRKHGIRQMLFGPATMLPRWKDVKDCIGMFRWFFLGGSKPRFDRWTYWEKFDYVAEVGGSMIIATTGLMLWFPEFFAMFLPGWMYNVATIVHGYEALLAIGFIFTIHFFNAHLRMEKFPVDDVMFTGCLSEEEFKHERPVEYERLAASGELQSLRVEPPPAWYRPMAVLLGTVAMLIGTALVVLIVLAGVGVL